MTKQDKPDTPQHQTSKIDALPNSAHVSFEPGTVLLDRYEVIDLLGQGGMGSVFHIKHLHLKSDFALKVLNKQADKTLWRRFEIEARTASRLDHPNLIKVYDSGILPDGQPFIVMELVKGHTLAELIAKHGRIPVRKTLKIFIQVGFALAYAHQNGVIHRDLKPSNIMLTKGLDGSLTSAVKVVDLGIAKLTGIEEFTQQSLTRTGEIFGSPLYMSPEQCKGSAVDGRADLYSLGCAMYEALTGAPPFVGENALSTMMKHQMDTPLALKEASMGIVFPHEVEASVQKLLEKEPSNRFGNAQLLTAELVKIEQDLSDSEIDKPSGQRVSSQDLATASGAPGLLRRYGIIILLMIASYLLGMLTISLKNAIPPAKTIQKEPFRPVIPFPNGNDRRTHLLPDENSNVYFSILSPDKKQRIFRFPKDKSVGKFFLKEKPTVEAIGEVHLPVDEFWVFRPDPRFLDSPKLLSRFRKDEVTGLELTDEARSNLNVLEILPSLPRLQSLKIAMDVDDKAIEYIRQIPSLKILDVSNTRITGDALAALSGLTNLTKLSCSGLENSEALVRRLSQSKKLEELDIEAANLTSADLILISKIGTLRYLYVGGNPKIDDIAVKSLIELKNLKNLSVSSCGITTKSFDTFAKLKALQYLQVSEGQFSDAEVKDLKRRLKAHVEVHGRPIYQDVAAPSSEIPSLSVTPSSLEKK
ncbi:MAG: hypothetical protein C0507_18185 [Cyanobacteria bacterium PR.3.49]|nr:hypothetical protein [Cyanobacteria bacterium PR.3.49]